MKLRTHQQRVYHPLNVDSPSAIHEFLKAGDHPRSTLRTSESEGPGLTVQLYELPFLLQYLKQADLEVAEVMSPTAALEKDGWLGEVMIFERVEVIVYSPEPVSSSAGREAEMTAMRRPRVNNL
jgi:hypothetical protein